jgi:aminoglycoside 2''-phosphotransferase
VNDVAIVNEEMVFRFSKNGPQARELLANELRVLALIRKYVDISVPDIGYQAEDFIVYRFIRGSALQRNDLLSLGEADRNRVLGQLAAFLRQLHSVPTEELRRLSIGQSDVNRSTETWSKLYDEIRKELFPKLMAHTREWVAKHFETALNDNRFLGCRPVLIHGEPAPCHILYDKSQKIIKGIVDFGTAGIGDPAADFACIIYHYGESALQRMAKFYPAIADAIDRARFWAGTLELQWALKSLRTTDPIWSLAHLGGARDVMPIGSMWHQP